MADRARWTIAWVILAAVLVGGVYVVADTAGALNPIVDAVTRLTH